MAGSIVRLIGSFSILFEASFTHERFCFSLAVFLFCKQVGEFTNFSSFCLSSPSFSLPTKAWNDCYVLTDWLHKKSRARREEIILLLLLLLLPSLFKFPWFRLRAIHSASKLATTGARPCVCCCCCCCCYRCCNCPTKSKKSQYFSALGRRSKASSTLARENQSSSSSSGFSSARPAS